MSNVIIFVNHLSDPMNFTSYITVVSTRVSAYCYKRGTISSERSYRRHNHFCLFCKSSKIVNIARISNEYWNFVAIRVYFDHLLFDIFKLTFSPSGDSPLDLRAILISHVFSSQFTCKSSGSKENEI